MKLDSKSSMLYHYSPQSVTISSQHVMLSEQFLWVCHASVKHYGSGWKHRMFKRSEKKGLLENEERKKELFWVYYLVQ